MPYTVLNLVAQARAVIEEIDPTRLRTLQAGGVPVIDVRAPGDFAEGHVPGAADIPRGALEWQVDDRPAVNGARDERPAHRRTGGRCALSAEALKRSGFDRPPSPAGGWRRRVQEGGATETPTA